MDSYPDSNQLSLRDTARGIAVRAGILSVGGLIVGTFLFSLAAKAASGIVKIFAAAILVAIGGGYAAFEVKKLRRRIGDSSRGAIA